MQLRKKRSALLGCVIFGIHIIIAGCASEAGSPVGETVRHPQWTRNLSIYEVNLRQFTESGTFQEFETHLPRLKKLGVGIIWFMPIHPIGSKNRKGGLGSYYSVQDYLAVNPEHGTMDDFKTLVGKIHEMGMYVILDWVANHTAWDNGLVEEHPDWFTRDSRGNLQPPVPDWSDVIDLDYSKPGVRQYMIEAMKFWVRETDIDGYRCDVAGMVPMDFWEKLRSELDKIKPVFMLAEAEGSDYHRKAFDMTYGWEMHHLINLVAQGKRTAATLDSLLDREAKVYPRGAYRMQFTSNHDENSWKGDVFERMGDAAEVFAVYAATIPDMPLLYGGQEAGLNKRLAFFDKDPIQWREHEFAQLYRTLFHEKLENRALWNGEFGGELQRIKNSDNTNVFSFYRGKGGNKVLVVLNLSGDPRTVALQEGELYPDSYRNLFDGTDADIMSAQKFQLDDWDYRVYVK